MRKSLTYISEHFRTIARWTLLIVSITVLFTFALGNLVKGVGPSEALAASINGGWQQLLTHPLYFPIKFLHDLLNFVNADSNVLLRLPNVLFGIIAAINMFWLIKLWHGTKTSVFGGLLFITSAWVLHVSRIATYDVLYLWGMTALLLNYALLLKYPTNLKVKALAFVNWGLILYVPGMIWLLIIALTMSRQDLVELWSSTKSRSHRMMYVLAGTIWATPLIVSLFRPEVLKLWLGLPTQLSQLSHILKDLAAVPLHLFVRGPQYPELWLDRAPILDVFTLFMCLIGVYFYIRHVGALRSRLLLVLAITATILVALGGAVSLSVLIPLLYVSAAAGIAFLLREWLQVFPNNPLARSIGIGLIAVAVGVSCIYNMRAYFIAWPHNQATKTIFQYRR